ncbi:MAG: hypothetical protein LWY06_14080 [Firmicutes bacterium]|nr:hypothetical protein [Bacillota bacterium]
MDKINRSSICLTPNPQSARKPTFKNGVNQQPQTETFKLETEHNISGIPAETDNKDADSE